MSRSKSSQGWLKEHFDDEFVKRSQQEGYRSRASYKLLGIHGKDRLFKPGMTVVDLGAAPGGWSQVAAPLVQPGGLVIASDILPMDALPDVDFIQGDFTEEDCFQKILARLDKRPVDIVISDMAPNISGMKEIDQPRSMYLLELATDFADNTLAIGGTLLMKVFQGQGFEELMRDLRHRYQSVATRKPEASRARSREVFLLCKGFKGSQGG